VRRYLQSTANRYQFFGSFVAESVAPFQSRKKHFAAYLNGTSAADSTAKPDTTAVLLQQSLHQKLQVLASDAITKVSCLQSRMMLKPKPFNIADQHHAASAKVRHDQIQYHCKNSGCHSDKDTGTLNNYFRADFDLSTERAKFCFGSRENERS